MKLILVDENLPRDLNLPTSLPVMHATDLGPSATDTMLWDHARKNNALIVTKDADFSSRSLLSPPPPWIAWIRLGNLRRGALTDHIRRAWPQVEPLFPKHRLVTIHADAVQATE